MSFLLQDIGYPIYSKNINNSNYISIEHVQVQVQYS